MVGLRTGPSKHSYQFRRTTAIVADGDDVAQWAFLVLSHGFEDINKVIGSAPAGKDDDAVRFCGTHG